MICNNKRRESSLAGRLAAASQQERARSNCKHGAPRRPTLYRRGTGTEVAGRLAFQVGMASGSATQGHTKRSWLGRILSRDSETGPDQRAGPETGTREERESEVAWPAPAHTDYTVPVPETVPTAIPIPTEQEKEPSKQPELAHSGPAHPHLVPGVSPPGAEIITGRSILSPYGSHEEGRERTIVAGHTPPVLSMMKKLSQQQQPRTVLLATSPNSTTSSSGQR